MEAGRDKRNPYCMHMSYKEFFLNPHGAKCQEGDNSAVLFLLSSPSMVSHGSKTHRATRGPEGLQCAVKSFAENRSLVSFLRSKARDEGAAGCCFELFMHNSRKV